MQAFNHEVATRLRETARLLRAQKANPFRVNAYLHAADTLDHLEQDVAELMRQKGVDGLVALPAIGEGIARSIYEYIATVNTYMAIPFFAIMGINVTALRTMPIAQSTTAMIFLYLLARELYNRRVAMVTVFMLAVSPSFVFWSRQGVFVTSVTIPLSMAAVWVWLRWWRHTIRHQPRVSP